MKNTQELATNREEFKDRGYSPSKFATVWPGHKRKRYAQFIYIMEISFFSTLSKAFLISIKTSTGFLFLWLASPKSVICHTWGHQKTANALMFKLKGFSQKLWWSNTIMPKQIMFNCIYTFAFSLWIELNYFWRSGVGFTKGLKSKSVLMYENLRVAESVFTKQKLYLSMCT